MTSSESDCPYISDELMAWLERSFSPLQWPDAIADLQPSDDLHREIGALEGCWAVVQALRAHYDAQRNEDPAPLDTHCALNEPVWESKVRDDTPF